MDKIFVDAYLSMLKEDKKVIKEDFTNNPNVTKLQGTPKLVGENKVFSKIKQVIDSDGIQNEYKEQITDVCINKLCTVPSLRKAILNNEDDLTIADEICDALNTVCNLTQKTEDDKFEEKMRIENHQKRVHKDTAFGPDSDCYDAVRNIFRDCLEFDTENSDYDLSEVDVDGLTQEYFEDCLDDIEVKEKLQAYVADTEGETDAYDELENAINYWIMDNIVMDLENKASFGKDWQWQ